MTDAAALDEILSYTCKYFHWAGADLLNVTSAKGRRQMVVIENNSCPSGQKSMPLMDDSKEHGGYYALIENSFIPFSFSNSLQNTNINISQRQKKSSALY